MTTESLIDKLTRLIEVKQESWELHYSAREIAAACIEMHRQHQAAQAAPEVAIAAGVMAIIASENTPHKMLPFRAEGYAKACAEAWGAEMEVDKYFHFAANDDQPAGRKWLRKYLQQYEASRQAERVSGADDRQRAYDLIHPMTDFQKEVTNDILDTLLERFELRRRR